MVQDEDAQQNLETVRERVFTPEPFSPQWNSDPVDLLAIPLDFPYSASEWDAIFEVLIGLLSSKERQIWDRAIRNLIGALEIEQSQHSNCDDYQPKPTVERIRGIFEAIATQALNTPNLFELFCSRLQLLAEKPPYDACVLEWLDQLAVSEDRQIPTETAILAAQIFFGAYNSTWQDVGTTLLEMLDHIDLNVRACAAYQIGKFCGEKWLLEQTIQQLQQFEQTDSADISALNQIRERMAHQQKSTDGIPALNDMMSLIRDKELERPGVAGAFWNVIPKAGFDAREWLLDILENSPEPEPYIPYFPCNLAFDAHERFSRDAKAIRRLTDAGRVELALMAATQESDNIPELKPLLIELGHHPDPETIRIASWHLAYFHHYLHPRGAELGYVERVRELSEIDLFLLFNQEKESESPYAAVIYPKETDRVLNRIVAQKWVDQIFPETVRGSRREDLPSGFSQYYQNGYIDYRASEPNTSSTAIALVIIGYRSLVPWNPKQFL